MFFWHDVVKVLIGHIKPKSFGQRLKLGSSEPVKGAKGFAWIF